MRLSKDLREFVELLNSRKAKYLLVGGHAVGMHGHLRFTQDIDFLVDTSRANAAILVAAVNDFGFGSIGLTEADFTDPGMIIQLGRAPNRIDLLTSIAGITFEEAWEARIQTDIDGLPISVISKDLLVQNKLASGRPQDLADVAQLRKIKK